MSGSRVRAQKILDLRFSKVVKTLYSLTSPIEHPLSDIFKSELTIMHNGLQPDLVVLGRAELSVSRQFVRDESKGGGA